MLTVWTMCTGDKYSTEYVHRLQRDVGICLTLPHRFACITEHDIPGVDCVKPPTDFPGWFGKIGLFKPGFCADSNLWLDLDVVLTGELNNMVLEYAGCYFSAPKNWAQSGWGGVQSSVMLWQGGKGCHAETIYRNFDPARINWPPISAPGVLYGDQELCTELRDAGRLSVTHIEPELIRSYKYHCRQGLPQGCKVVVFHGKPDPHEVSEDWFKW
jgi:hypothetical protein